MTITSASDTGVAGQGHDERCLPPGGTPDDRYFDGGPAAAAIASVAAAVSGLPHLDLSAPGTGGLLDLLRATERQARALYAFTLALIGQIDQRGLAAPAGHASTAGLIRNVITIAHSDAAARVALAARICPATGITGTTADPELPHVAAALATGTVSARHANAIVTTFKKMPPRVGADIRESVERFLVEQAAHMDPITFEHTARHTELMADPDGTDEKHAHEHQELHIGNRRPNGLTKIWGLLDDIATEQLRVAFGALCSPSAERKRTEHHGEECRDRATTESDNGRADRSAGDAEVPDDDPTGRPNEFDHNASDRPNSEAGGTPAVGPSAASPVSSDLSQPHHSDDLPIWRSSRPPLDWAPLGTCPGDYAPIGRALVPRLFPDDHRPPDTGSFPGGAPPDQRTAATKRAQALGLILTRFLESGGAPTQAGEPAQLLVTIDEHSLRHRVGSGTLHSGTPLPVNQVRMLACQAGVIPAVLSGTRETLDIGRSSRTFNTAIQRAVALRDQGCVFPGCAMPAKWSEFHHIIFWKDGGPSTYENCCQLCRRHHHLIHKEQWTIRMASDGHPDLIPPATVDLNRKALRNSSHRPAKFDWAGPDSHPAGTS
ncbi:HNH endonuclease [Nakamurella panacisegetis]|uniref:HNH endonuclease n=1 Tax=Nakamurella panacisegetis TaxID=1090615 RepID=A0A1H0L081_9ACTN|nr:HNH endonuclease signature motif containing protein [Nakamurella panacisegetis]SDO61628.1 HNH endonuclease [Nakamurella panacisegetis]